MDKINYAVIKIATEKEKETLGRDGREFTEVFGLPVFLYSALINEDEKILLHPLKKSEILENFPSMNAFLKKASEDMPKLFRHDFVEIYDSHIRDDSIILTNNTKELSPSILLYRGVWDEVLSILEAEEVYVMPTFTDGIFVVKLDINEENTRELQKEIETLRESEQLTLDNLITDKLFYFKKGMSLPRQIED